MIRPKKSLGQNFLNNGVVLDNIVNNVVQTYRRTTSLQKLQKLYDDGNITEKVFKEEKKRIEEVLTNKSLFDGTADLAKFMFDPSEAKLIQKLWMRLN